jgi:cell pole-organizing protein PopZ
MEEILASIRRIIESNDPTTDAAALHAVPSTYDEDEIEDFDEGAFVPDVVANDPGLPRQPDTFAVTEMVMGAAPAEKSMSLADVAARVRAASARHQEMASSRPLPRLEEPEVAVRQPVAAEAEYVEPPVFREMTASVVSLPMPELRPSLVEATVPSLPAMTEQAPAMPELAAETVQMVEPAREQPPVADTMPEPVEIAAVPAETAAGTSIAAMAGLLSEAAGAQVAKSFGELAEVFDGLERRSVEDMAQEMLRPMLQEWLDDNLPTLVERLVREEIERVARGPRR